MIIFLITIIFAIFLNECTAAGGTSYYSLPRMDDNFNIDKFIYKGDPIRFACITKDSQREFYMSEVKRSIPSALVDRLDNGKGLSLLFHGVAKIVDSRHRLYYSFSMEWFRASGNNVCIVSYAYDPSSSAGLNIFGVVNEMVTTRRLEYVAKMGRDLVWFLRNKCLDNLSQVDVTGFGFGVHVAGQMCQYLSQRTDERVRLLLALDPIKVPYFQIFGFFLGNKMQDTIKREYASYVQVIHTSTKFGIWDQMGDVDVYVKYEGENKLGPLNEEHGISLFIHLATSTKRLFITAVQEENRDGKVVRRRVGFVPEINQNECEVGVYGSWGSSKKVFLSLKSHSVFWDAIGELANSEITSETISADLDEEKCTICYDNKKNAILDPCGHMLTCVSCWNTWKQQNPTCPVCRQVVRKYTQAS